jgi:protein-disulfide isomerase
MQLRVEAELKQGKIVTILFWNPKATDDQAVNEQLQSVVRKLRGGVVVHAALAKQIVSFGTIIRGVKVYGTPTVLIINQRGQAVTLTGYTDAYAIEQAIGEARHVSRR